MMKNFAFFMLNFSGEDEIKNPPAYLGNNFCLVYFYPQ